MYLYFTLSSATTVVNTAAVAETRPTPLPQTSSVISHRIPICVVIDVAQIAFHRLSLSLYPAWKSTIYTYISYKIQLLSPLTHSNIHYEFFPTLTTPPGSCYANPSPPPPPPTDVYISVYSVTELMNWVCHFV